MKISEITQWIALLSKGKIDDGIARFGKKRSELAGRDLVSVEPTDARFSELDLEYRPADQSRLLFVDAHFVKPEPISHAQLISRFGKPAPIPTSVDDFSGVSPGEYFIFHEGDEEYCLNVYFEGTPEETIDVTRLQLRRVIDFGLGGSTGGP